MSADPGPALGDQPSRMPPADLGSVFGTDRSQGLARRLAPRQPQAPAPTPAEAPETEAGQTDEALAAPAPGPPVRRSTAPRSKPARAAGSPGDQDVSTRKTVVVYVRRTVRDKLRTATAPDSGRTQTDLVLAAIDATHARLAEHFRPDQEGSLFAPRAGRRKVRRDEPQAQISIRVQVNDLAIIDRLVDESGAPSRSVLIDTAVDLHLPG